MNLLFTINRSYVSQMLICVRSLQRFPVKDSYEIYILHQTLLDEDIRHIKNQESQQLHFHFIELDPLYFKDFPLAGGYPKEMYFRLLAASFLPDTMERILYLDPDIIIIHPLDTLFQMDFENHLWIGTTHVDKTLTKINARRLGLSHPVPYINTGVLLMNLPALRKETNMAKDIQNYISTHSHVLKLPDQDIMTALYGNSVKLVDPLIYNLSDRILAFHNLKNPSMMIDEDWVKEHTVIIHYCGKNKPWKDHYIGILKPFYDEVAL